MGRGGRLAAWFCVVYLLAACGSAELPLPAASGRPDRVESPDTLVIVGHADHGAITEPLVEVIPLAADDSAEVTVRFDAAEPMLIGMEGTIFFLRVVAPDGTTVADRSVSGAHPTDHPITHLPGGDYTFEAYYRTCDGNCGLLDLKQSMCNVFASVAPRTPNELVVSYRPSRSTCAVGPPVEPSAQPSRD